jgi:hypothetical protein
MPIPPVAMPLVSNPEYQPKPPIASYEDRLARHEVPKQGYIGGKRYGGVYVHRTRFKDEGITVL